MVYQIKVLSAIALPEESSPINSDPESAYSDLQYMQERFPGARLTILRDGVEITESQLRADIESWEIQKTMEESTRLPSTYRRGWGTQHDDIAQTADGDTARVWKPPNPDDRFE